MSAAKRFYDKVAIAKLEDGFGVTLDGRTLKTQGKHKLLVERAYIAELIAAEWDAQIETIKPETMPVTRLINVAIELTPNNRDQLVEEARRYAGTDLLCYRAADPSALTARQAEQWDPVLAWAAKKGIALETTNAVLAIDQPSESLDRVAEFANTLTDLDLTLMVHLTAVFGSAILAKAVIEKHLTCSRAFELSRLDNLYQIEHWGEDEEAAENAANLAAEVSALCKILE